MTSCNDAQSCKRRSKISFLLDKRLEEAFKSARLILTNRDTCILNRVEFKPTLVTVTLFSRKELTWKTHPCLKKKSEDNNYLSGPKWTKASISFCRHYSVMKLTVFILSDGFASIWVIVYWCSPWMTETDWRNISRTWLSPQMVLEDNNTLECWTWSNSLQDGKGNCGNEGMDLSDF